MNVEPRDEIRSSSTTNTFTITRSEVFEDLQGFAEVSLHGVALGQLGTLIPGGFAADGINPFFHRLLERFDILSPTNNFPMAFRIQQSRKNRW